MGHNARNDEIRDNITRMRREWQRNAGLASYTIALQRTIQIPVGECRNSDKRP